MAMPNLENPRKGVLLPRAEKREIASKGWEFVLPLAQEHERQNAHAKK